MPALQESKSLPVDTLKIAKQLSAARRRLHESPGFTLMELVMTIVFTAIAFPGILSLLVNTSINSHDAELMTIANSLAQEQMEIILADKAGTGTGYGFSNITTAKYANVNPASPYNAFTRTVTVTSQNLAGSASYPAKVIVVRVSHPMIPPVVLTGFILDHASIS